jgi:hypothetical protein
MNVKYEIDEEKEKTSSTNYKILTQSFILYPKITFALINISVISILIVIGVFLSLIIKSYITNKYYGEHCSTEFDCSPSDNLICSNGICKCKPNTFLKSNRQTCGILIYLQH